MLFKTSMYFCGGLNSDWNRSNRSGGSKGKGMFVRSVDVCGEIKQILSANTILFRAEIIGLLAALETLPTQELALMACKVVCTKAGPSGLFD